MDYSHFDTNVYVACPDDTIIEILQRINPLSIDVILVKPNRMGDPSPSLLGVIQAQTLRALAASTEMHPKKKIESLTLEPVQVLSERDFLEGNIQLHIHTVIVDSFNQSMKYIDAAELSQALRDALKRQQMFFATLLDSVNDAVTCVDRNGTVLYWNRIAEEIYGVRQTEIVGKRIGDFFSQGSIMLFKILDEGRPIRQVYHHPRPDKHVLINAAPIYTDDELVGAIATEQDISRIVKIHEELSDLRSDEAFPVDSSSNPFQRIYGNSHGLVEAVECAKQAVPLEIPAFINGEKGTGKRMLAEAIHATRFSSESEHPLLTLNVGTIPPSMLESELFGYQANAFGGDSQAKPGKLELAFNGSLLIEETETLPSDIQLKLAEVMERKEFRRIGSNTDMTLSARLLFLSEYSADDLYKRGILRDELYYQINRICISIPPLRDRPEDILELSQYYLHQFAREYHKSVPTLAPEVIAAFTVYSWPGNVRELRNTIERLVIFQGEGPITIAQIPAPMRLTTMHSFEKGTKVNSSNGSDPVLQMESVALQDLEKQAILSALRKTSGNKAAAAKELGISRGTLYAKLRQFEIDDGADSY